MAETGEDVEEPKAYSLHEALVRRAGKIEYDNLPTHIGGVEVIVERGLIPPGEDAIRHFGKTALRRFANLVQTTLPIKKEMEAATERYDKKRFRLRDEAVAYGFRGLIWHLSANRRMRLPLHPRHRFEDWDVDMVERITKPIGHEVVKRTVNFSLTLPEETELTHEEVLRQGTDYFAGMFGLADPDELARAVRADIVREVDVDSLADLALKGLLHVPEGAAKLKESWPLNFNQVGPETR